MNTHALGVLEFRRVLELVASRAASQAGAAVIRALMPADDVSALEAEHARVSAMRAIRESEGGWQSHSIPAIEAALGRLRVEGASLSGEDLAGVLVLLRSSRLTRDALSSKDQPLVAIAVLSVLRERLIADGSAEAAIDRVVADDGAIKDNATPTLRRIRKALRGSEGELIALLERIMQQIDARLRVPDMSVTVRNGRYVIPIRREARGAVGGLVHDTSSTGATLFVEPPAAIEACNQIRELESEELREVDRLLLELTERIRPLRDRLADAADAMAQLDALYARARFATDFRCGVVTLTAPGNGFRLAAARHPLLVEQGIDVVPFDLEMDAGERTLLVSGPNTGGKTVLLKTLGLLSVMAQAGLPIPAATGSTIVVYNDVFADVGDEQSIAASLSTFSAHLKNIAELLRLATPRSLVLLDELGSGTDPLEGAALGGSIIETLTERGAMTIATTHLGALKELASEMPGIVNASLQFDADALAPTYRLIKGIPGRSYGISIARRLHLPEDVLQRAEHRVPQVERDVNALLASLEQRSAELTRLDEELRASRQTVQEQAHRVADREARLREREARLRERERAFERESRQETRRYLLEARAQVERTIKDLKRSADAGEEAARAARQRVEQLAEVQHMRLEQLDSDENEFMERRAADRQEPATGDMVHIQPLGGRVGRVLDFRDDEVVVAIGDVKMTFPRTALVKASAQDLPAQSVSIRGDLPEEHAPTEIDLRGMRAVEIEEVVLSAIDAAIRADLVILRIIHGKGTGVLRERVIEILRKDTRVKGFRYGAWNEGGAGVTLVQL